MRAGSSIFRWVDASIGSVCAALAEVTWCGLHTSRLEPLRTIPCGVGVIAECWVCILVSDTVLSEMHAYGT